MRSKKPAAASTALVSSPETADLAVPLEVVLTAAGFAELVRRAAAEKLPYHIYVARLLSVDVISVRVNTIGETKKTSVAERVRAGHAAAERLAALKLEAAKLRAERDLRVAQARLEAAKLRATARPAPVVAAERLAVAAGRERERRRLGETRALRARLAELTEPRPDPSGDGTKMCRPTWRKCGHKSERAYAVEVEVARRLLRGSEERGEVPGEQRARVTAEVTAELTRDSGKKFGPREP